MLVLALAAPAFADDAADISKLIKGGQYAEAMGKVDASLAQKPRDPQLRFFKGLILTEQNKSADAIVVFTKLTEDFPDLPEPYNNLAVLFASSGQYDKARAALEMAIRTNPTYATAHENLGDVYAKLASQAYDKALQLDSGNAAAKSKLTMVRTLIGNPSNPVAQKGPAQAPVAAAPVKPPVIATITAKPDSKAAKAETKAEAKAETKTEAKVEARNDADSDEVLKSVNAWAKAWSNKDVKAYLAMYGNDFKTPKGESRKAWSEERRSRIEGKGHISVEIDTPQVAVNGNSATVKFRQIYTSDHLSANSKKTLVLDKQAGKWQIVQERTGY